MNFLPHVIEFESFLKEVLKRDIDPTDYEDHIIYSYYALYLHRTMNVPYSLVKHILDLGTCLGEEVGINQQFFSSFLLEPENLLTDFSFCTRSK